MEKCELLSFLAQMEKCELLSFLAQMEKCELRSFLHKWKNASSSLFLHKWKNASSALSCTNGKTRTPLFLCTKGKMRAPFFPSTIVKIRAAASPRARALHAPWLPPRRDGAPDLRPASSLRPHASRLPPPRQLSPPPALSSGVLARHPKCPQAALTDRHPTAPSPQVYPHPILRLHPASARQRACAWFPPRHSSSGHGKSFASPVRGRGSAQVSFCRHSRSYGLLYFLSDFVTA